MVLNNRKEYKAVSRNKKVTKETNDNYKFLPLIPLHKNFYKKKWFIVSSAILAVALIGVFAGWAFINLNSNFMETFFPSEQSKIDAKNKISNQKISDADKLVNSGDIEAAISAYDDVIATIDDPFKKSLAILSKANIYYNEDNQEKAIEVAKEAEALNSNYNVNYFLASLYSTSDYEKALEHYKKALELLDMSQPTSNDTANYIQSQIDEISAIIKGEYKSAVEPENSEDYIYEEVENE